MQVETIGIKDMLQYMDGGAPFSLAFVTMDKKKDRGGEWITIEEGRKHQTFSTPSSSASQVTTSTVHRNPKHYSNSTRNILLPNGEIRKVHIRLIRRFNGKTVI